MSQQIHWEHVYQQKDSKMVSWYQPYPRTSMELIQQSQLENDARIIDVGGGASTLVDSLLDAQYRSVSVLDISQEALHTTQNRLGEKAKNVRWLAQDITAFRPSERYQLWHDRAVFHFMTTPKALEGYITSLHHSLAPGGHIVLATFALDGPKQCSGLPIEAYDVEKLTQTLGPNFVLLSSKKETHTTPYGTPQPFVYFHLQYNQEALPAYEQRQSNSRRHTRPQHRTNRPTNP